MMGALLTTIVWMVATFLTKPDDVETLQNFVMKVNPGGPGWKKYSKDVSSEPWIVPKGLLSMALGCTAIYGLLLGIGQILYANTGSGLFLCGTSLVTSIGLFKLWR